MTNSENATENLLQKFVEIRQNDFEGMKLVNIVQLLSSARSALDRTESIAVEMRKAYDHLSIEVLPDRMDEEGITTMNIKGIGRLQLAPNIRCSVPAANKSKLQEWLRDNGQGSLVSPTVNSSTLKAFVKEMIKEDGDWPESLLTVHAYSRATIVKS